MRASSEVRVGIKIGGRQSVRKKWSTAICLGLLCLFQNLAWAQTGWSSWSAPTADGSDFHSKTLQGKVVVVSVWASWCSSSRRQMPLLSQLQTAHSDERLQVLSFSLDRTPDQHQKYLDSTNLRFPAIFARNGLGLEAVRLLQTQTGPLEAVPTLVIFDRSGHLVHRSVGFSSLSRLKALIAPLLKD